MAAFLFVDRLADLDELQSLLNTAVNRSIELRSSSVMFKAAPATILSAFDARQWLETTKDAGQVDQLVALLRRRWHTGWPHGRQR